MYSCADGLRAVELYIRLGKWLNAIIRQLGYPTKNALSGWYREYLQHLDLRIEPVARPPKFCDVLHGMPFLPAWLFYASDVDFG